MLLFELFIPLVLFVILLSIRKRQPARPQNAYRWGTQALPSSGAIPILQSFCENNNQNVNKTDPHFKHINEEGTGSFLRRLQVIGRQHNFFNPGYTPTEMEEIPAIYKKIIDGPASNLHNSFKNAKDFQVQQVLMTNETLQQFVRDNISMPDRDIQALLHSKVNVKEVYKLVFGSYPDAPDSPLRVRRSLEDPNLGELSEHYLANNLTSDLIKSVMSQMMPSFQNGLLFELMEEPALMHDKKLIGFLVQLMSQSGDLDFPETLSPQEIAEILKLIVLSPNMLRKACDQEEFSRLLKPQPPYNQSDEEEVQRYLCNMTDAERLTLSDILKSDISEDTIITMLHLHTLNTSVIGPEIKEFLEEVKKFYIFQTQLYELSKLAEALPKDGCDMMDDGNDTLVTPSPTPKHSKLQVTPSPTPTPEKKKKNKFAGLLKFWDGMQQILCGHERHPKKPEVKDKGQGHDADSHTKRPDVHEDHHRSRRSADSMTEMMAESFNFGDLGLDGSQQKNLKILIHALYSNPKVLYAPNNTGVTTIIKKANETFRLIDSVNDYAREWLNISSSLRSFLQQNSTADNLKAIRQIQKNIRNQKSVISYLTEISEIANFVNMTIPDVSFFIHEIDVIDNAACTWLALLKGINLNVFKGFRTEWELSEYFLTKQYSENITALAGLVFENIEANKTLPAHIRYKIRQNATMTPTTKQVRKKYWYPGPGSGEYPYYSFGFLWIQDIIERAIIDVQVGRDVVEPGSYLIRMPYPCWLYDQFLFMVEHVMPLCLTISWVYSVAMLVQSIVYEKERRLKEVMKMMGLSNAVHWFAWFITTFLQFSLTMGILTVMLHYGHVLKYSNAMVVFTTLEIFAIATISFCFLISTLYSKAKVAAACAGIVYFLTYVPYMYIAIKEDVAGDSISAIVKTTVSLFSTTAFGLGGKYFAFYEEEGVGVQWNNIYISPVEGDQYNLLMVLMMMMFDAFLYGILAWYIGNAFPGSYGLPKPWYFPFTRVYWCEGNMKSHDNDCTSLLDLCRHGNRFSVMEEDQACAMDRDPDYASKFESEPSHLRQGVCIDNLTKVYKSGKKVAVNKLSLNLYEGQITSFLGHNGAGKTTTMSVLTGLFPPTSGFAQIYGHDIRTEMEVIRQGLGMCPQHNVLFDKLTVEEHLWFYARLKGMKSNDLSSEMDMMFEDLGLPKKRKSHVDCLSGGMQRKLSVAIAFIGGSRTVILDEPTAGVDPYARRAIWDLLRKYKNGRTILLSTHHMDEADLLGDRIAIISNGELKCCGSPLFLKNTYCEGYHLHIVKQEAPEDLMSVDSDSHDSSPHSKHPFVSKCESSKVTEFIQKHVLTAYLKSESRRELHYILPYEEAKKGNFEKLFDALETQQEELFISSFGVADSTLEEVFLEVTENASKELEAEKEDDEKQLESLDPQPVETDPTHSHPSATPFSDLLDEASGGLSELEMSLPRVLPATSNELELGHLTENTANENEVVLGHMTENRTNSRTENTINMERLEQDRDVDNKNMDLLYGRGSYTLNNNWLLLNHFRAMIIKRFHYITRNWKGLFSQILLPALFVSVAMTVALSAPKDEDPPPLELSPSQYFNLTQPRGNYIPYSNENSSYRAVNYLYDAGPDDLIRTFHLPSGVGATCVLKKAKNSSIDQDIFRNLNVSHHTLELLAKYYEEGCERVFVNGIQLDNYVPRVDVITNKDKLKKDNITVYPTGPSSSEPYFPSCICKKDNSGFECSKNYRNPKKYRVVTRDIMQDITPEKPTRRGDYYLYTTDEYRLHRYGGFSFGTERSFVPGDFGKTSPTLFRTLAVRGTALAWYNNKGYHSMPVYLNTLNNAILRANLPKSKGHPAAYGITLVNHPMNKTNNHLDMNYILQGSDVLIAIFIIVAMSFVPASFVVFLVYERGIKAKHLQFVSGLNPVMYWLANYVWDMCNYVIPAFCIVIILLIFQIPAYVSPNNLPAVVALFLLYGWSMTPLMYPVSFIFEEPSTAYIFLIVINLFTGITCIVSSFLLEIFSYDKHLEKIHHILKDVFLMFPNYCLGRGLMDIAFNQYKNDFYFKTGQYDKMLSPFEWDLISKKLTVMAIGGLVFFIITLLCEYRFFIKSSIQSFSNARKHKYIQKDDTDEDVDVAAERKRVLRGNGKKDLLRLENLTKVYKTSKLGCQLAVDKLCIGVPAGECFGLLGVNGAGKTTTFKMLTGDLSPTYGEAYLNRYSILKDMLKVQQNIGYCPQFDSLFDELTAREHIQLYARLRGVPPKEEKQVVEWALSKLDLTQYSNKPSGTYSGGNKRKLSTALALIGHPPLIFMDEPTTGMDPHSRRFLWDLILNLIKDGRSVILTSHSMEECEALCTRLAIMVNGKFKCLGSIQHLKNKYGDGYTFCLRLKGPDYERAQRQAQRFVDKNFPEAIIKECHYNILQFEIKCRNISLSYVFSKMESAQKDLSIEDYSVSQNTLDNVFINFVKQQMEIVQEEAHHTPSVTMTTQRTRTVSSASIPLTADDSDDDLLMPVTREQFPLETEDDDEPLLQFDETGTHLTLLNMDVVNV